MQDLIKAVMRFRDERDWKQFHNPKDLAISVALEAAELLEHFQWKSNEEVANALKEPGLKGRIGEEMADILLLLISLADVAGVDLQEAAWRKLRKNEERYPVEKAKGTAKKYDQFSDEPFKP
ncbi:MAG: nucleotide pyrophosphohydrolase [candidate division NC10 bacterium]|nr:nucleotide pyrophosphohydrolase [candidate division NC10 bacterium]